MKVKYFHFKKKKGKRDSNLVKVNIRNNSEDVSVFQKTDPVIANLLVCIKNFSEEYADGLLCRTGFPFLSVMLNGIMKPHLCQKYCFQYYFTRVI